MKSETVTGRKIPSNKSFKNKKIEDEMERNFNDYDDETIAFLISQLNEGIKRAKLEQFEKRLSQGRTVAITNISQIEQKLNHSESLELSQIVDKIGPINSLKLMNIINNGMSPEEQKRVYDLLKKTLDDNEVIRLNEILGKHMDE